MNGNNEIMINYDVDILLLIKLHIYNLLNEAFMYIYIYRVFCRSRDYLF